MGYQARFLAVLALGSMAVWACKDNSNKFIINHCQSASECAVLTTQVNPACVWPAGHNPVVEIKEHYGDIAIDRADMAYYFRDFHPTRNIVAVYSESVQKERQPNPPIEYNPASISALEGGTKPVPPVYFDYTDGDISGPKFFLACEWQLSGSNLIEHHVLEKVSACWEGEPCHPPVPLSVQTKTVDEVTNRCNQTCDTDRGQCNHYTLNDHDPKERAASAEARKLSLAIRTHPLPTTGSLAALFAQLGTDQCIRDPLQVAGNGSFTNQGSECWEGVPVIDPARSHYDKLVLHVPSKVSGTLARAPAASLMTIGTTDFFGRVWEQGQTTSVDDPIRGILFFQTMLS